MTRTSFGSKPVINSGNPVFRYVSRGDRSFVGRAPSGCRSVPVLPRGTPPGLTLAGRASLPGSPRRSGSIRVGRASLPGNLDRRGGYLCKKTLVAPPRKRHRRPQGLPATEGRPTVGRRSLSGEMVMSWRSAQRERIRQERLPARDGRPTAGCTVRKLPGSASTDD